MHSIPYRREIDGLRALAILFVIVFHLDSEWLPGGFVGVDVFFAISGYLVCSVILTQQDHGRFRFSEFYQRRMARLFPAFATMSIVTLYTASWIYSSQDFASCAAVLGFAILGLANFKLMKQGGYFQMSDDAQPLLHCWSLSIEEQVLLRISWVMLFGAGGGGLDFGCCGDEHTF